MTLYRCYMFDRDGHVLGPPDVIEAATDDDAATQAMRICGTDTRCSVVEVWQGDACICRLDQMAGRA